MKKGIIAHCIHHTHWDPFWYFTSQDAMVVFCYNVKEMLRAFDEGEIEDFFLDGQTAAIDEYLEVHPEDRERIRQLVESDRLIIGPFVSQLDPFICCGESIVNNLRLGMRHANALGKSSRIAYLADPFGQTIEFPKIFNQFGIHDFVLTRGVGDAHGVGNEFYLESNDGSVVLCHTLLAGYGYGTYAFTNKTLFTAGAEDYNRIDVDKLIRRLLDRSTLPGEFVFPLGFDQNPIMRNIPQLIDYYKTKKPDFEFRYTNWKAFFDRVRRQGRDLQTLHVELTSPQYHRLHLSGMNSARADIKTILDRAERSLTYETQPLMSMLDSVGIKYDHGIIDRAWYTLINCQTHASATHIDATNRWMKENGRAALNYSEAAKLYLMRLVAASLKGGIKDEMNLVIFNTIPWERELVQKMTIVTTGPSFRLLDGEVPVDYTVLEQKRSYGGVIRKDKTAMTEDKWFYRTEILANVGFMTGIGYKTLTVKETDEQPMAPVTTEETCHSVETNRYRVEHSSQGIRIIDKTLGTSFGNFVYLEDGGDEGDSYDYSYPDDDKELIVIDNFGNANVTCLQTREYASLTVEGQLLVPASLERRSERNPDTPLRYRVTFEVNIASPIIRIHGSVENRANDHRLRLGIRTGMRNKASYAGTQFGYVKRESDPPEMSNWRENGFFEEPCSTRPLLNHVSAVGVDYTVTVFTRGLKEYQFTQESFSDIAVTVFRSVGYVGLPDLNRRPGRPSGLSNKIIEARDHQMHGENSFDIGIGFYSRFDGNRIMRDYAEFAVDAMYYQNQRIDTTIYPIAYFPINPLGRALPRQYTFMSFDGYEGSYGTVKKADSDNGYLLQLFNSDENEIDGFELSVGFDCPRVVHVNMLEEAMDHDNRTATRLGKGELKNLLLVAAPMR